MAEHTPGPWTVRDERQIAPNQRGAYPFYIDEGPAHRIAGVRFEADARLIAAAPDLLAALEEAVPAMTVPGYDSEEAIDLARDAIAKARGEVREPTP